MNEGAEPARRFYKSATAEEAAGGFTIALDERTLKTPGGTTFRVPTRALAEACAGEWREQTTHIIPARMPITQLAFAAIDWTAKDRGARIAYVAGFGETDLCCHRAESPAPLVARQAARWDRLVEWGALKLGAKLSVVTGIIAAPVSPGALAALRSQAAALDDYALTALSQAAGLSGSALIAFALLLGELDAQGGFEAAALDELWSLECWGEDAEARARLRRIRAEFDALAGFIARLAA